MNFNEFSKRHIGISENDLPKMLQAVGVSSIDELINQVVPEKIRLKKPLNLPEAMTEYEYLSQLPDYGMRPHGTVSDQLLAAR